jgi:hypothetical protein
MIFFFSVFRPLPFAAAGQPDGTPSRKVMARYQENLGIY